MKQTIDFAHSIGDVVYCINTNREAYANEIKTIRITQEGIRYIGNRHDFNESETVYNTENEAIIEIIKIISKDLK